MDHRHHELPRASDPDGKAPGAERFSSFKLDRIQRFASGLRSIRLHDMERVRGLAWSVLRTMMEEEQARPVSAEDLDEAVRMFAQFEAYEIHSKTRDRWMAALFAAGAGTGAWLLSRGMLLPGYITVVAALPVVLILRLCIGEWQLYRLRRPWGFGRTVLLFALKEVLADPRWEDRADHGFGRTVARNRAP